MTACVVCGRGDRETAFSVTAGAWLCLNCHLRAAPSESPSQIGCQLGIKPCRGCGEPLGERYAGLCWSCWAEQHPEPAAKLTPASQLPWQQFRKSILTALDRVDPARCVYIDKDRSAHICPVCRCDVPEYLSVRFHGQTCAADLVCSLGCDEHLVAAAIRKLTPTPKRPT